MKKHISMILVLALSIFSVSATAEEMRRIDSDGYLYFEFLQQFPRVLSGKPPFLWTACGCVTAFLYP